MANSNTRRFSIAAGGIVLILLAAGGYLAVSSVLDQRHLRQKTDEYTAKGSEFGEISDQTGCIQEGMLRARATTPTAAIDNGLTGYFVDSCLRSSRPTADFCALVPSSNIAAWKNVQCEKAGLDTSQTGCLSVLDAQVKYCRRNREE